MLQDNIKSAAVLYKDEILIPPRASKARHPHTRVPRTDAQTQARPHYIHNEYSYPTRQSSLTLYKYILSLSLGTWASVSPSRERDGWGLGVCLREVANFYFIKWRAWNRSGSMELGHLKNVCSPYPGNEMWAILWTLSAYLGPGWRHSRYERQKECWWPNE